MYLKAMYNAIAEHYATADQFGSITESHNAAVKQIKKEHFNLERRYKILDLGVGNGAFLKKIKPIIPTADFTGIDISTEMLARAAQTMPFTAIEASATEASQYLPNHSQDLVLAHFVNAYIPIESLFNEVNLLTKANGYFSLITTTYESFPIAQQYLAEFIAQGTLLSRVVGHYYKALIKNTTVATDFQSLTAAFKQYKFKIIHHQRLNITITLKNIDELVKFGIEGTWFLNSLSLRMLPKHFLLERLKRLFAQIFTFPYHDTHIIDVILAQKSI